jgi:hypothetical protein
MHNAQEQAMNLRIALITTLSLSLVAGCDEAPTQYESSAQVQTDPTDPSVAVSLAPEVETPLVPELAPVTAYEAPPVIDTEMSIQGVTVVDIDGDGTEELVTFDGTSLVLWTADEAGLVPSGLSFTSDVPIYAFHAGDFDGDGAGELLIELQNSWQLVGLTDGQLVVDHSLSRDPTTGTTGLTVADADADGRDDLILHDPSCATSWSHWESHCGDRRLEILGAGGHEGLTELPLGYAYGAWVTLADLDGDDHPEVVRCAMVETGTHLPHTAVIVMDPSSDEMDVMATFETAPGVRLEQPWAADMDGDGVSEVLARDVNSNTLLVFSYHDGVLSRLEDIEQMQRFEAVDLGGDARAELVTGSRVLQVFAADRTDQVSVEPSTFAGGAHVAIMDVDQDGLKDVVTAMPEGQMQVLFADGAGGLRGWDVHPISQWVDTVRAVDVGHDGRPDIIGTRADGLGTTVLNNTPKIGFVDVNAHIGHYQALVMDCVESTHEGGALCAGTSLYGFGPEVAGEFTASALLPEFLIPCGQNAWQIPIPHLTTGDFDGDGYDDVVVSMQRFTVRPEYLESLSGHAGQGAVLVFSGTADGGFEFDQSFQREHISTDVVAMDVNGDGLDELILIDGAGALETWGPVDGLWTMLDVTQHDEALFGLQVVTATGGPLLLAHTAEAQQVRAFHVSSYNTLAAHSALDFEGDVVSLTLADLDDDGDEDLIVATQGPDGIWASMQTDTGFDAPVALVRTGFTPASITAADFDRDGCPDIAASFKGVKGVVTISGQCSADK